MHKFTNNILRGPIFIQKPISPSIKEAQKEKYSQLEEDKPVQGPRSLS